MRVLISTFIVLLNALAAPCWAETVSLFSGTFDGDHPRPVMVAKVSRGDRFELSVDKASALVNYPEPGNPVIVERVQTIENGATVSCPWYQKLDGTPTGTRVDQVYAETINHKAFCDNGGCTDIVGRPLSQSALLYGKYNLPKCRHSDGMDAGFNALLWIETPSTNCTSKWCSPKLDTVQICCPEFTVERSYAELHYFDQLLIVDNYREQELTDLDVDFKKIYLTIENEKQERTTCIATDLLDGGGDIIKIANLKDCTLPAGDHFTMYAQSRFFLKETRACGKFVARGFKGPEGYRPDWFTGWYECDGKQDRSPIEKQYNYATRTEVTFIERTVSGGAK